MIVPHAVVAHAVLALISAFMVDVIPLRGYFIRMVLCRNPLVILFSYRNLFQISNLNCPIQININSL